ncbi:Meiotic expression up-regulated protein 10 [Smittium culicis]|uniref:Meiotic expression up-regulated protein 10 n=1 Tax=Smittium culicis TaxID=133412 RepID=A0A1R1Y5W8_9FUNG|nr:Meiotic expression up-regulated protein 10 [Smittium culicis]
MKLSIVALSLLPIAISASSIKQVLSKIRGKLPKGLLNGAKNSRNPNRIVCGGDWEVDSQLKIDQLNTCAAFDGNISITNSSLESVSLTKIQSITGSLMVAGNAGLKTFSFDSLTTVGEDIYISTNYLLQSVSFSELTGAGNVTLEQNFELGSVNLAKLKSSNDLSITDSSLKAIELQNLSSISGKLDISKNLGLLSVRFRSLVKIDGDLEININNQFNNLTAQMNSLTTIGGGATIRGLSSLILKSLSSIKSSLFIRDNSFTSLNLPALQSVNEGIHISRNAQLNSLNLSKLSTVSSGSIQVINNISLNNIGQNFFKSLTSVTGDVEFYGPISAFSFPASSKVSGNLKITGKQTLNCDRLTRAFKNVAGGNIICANVFV